MQLAGSLSAEAMQYVFWNTLLGSNIFVLGVILSKVFFCKEISWPKTIITASLCSLLCFLIQWFGPWPDRAPVWALALILLVCFWLFWPKDIEKKNKFIYRWLGAFALTMGIRIVFNIVFGLVYPGEGLGAVLDFALPICGLLP